MNCENCFTGLANVFAELPPPAVETFLGAAGLLGRGWMVEMAVHVIASGKKLDAGQTLTPEEGAEVIEFSLRVLLIVSNVAGGITTERRRSLAAYKQLQDVLVADGRLPDPMTLVTPADIESLAKRNQERWEATADIAEQFTFVDLMDAARRG